MFNFHLLAIHSKFISLSVFRTIIFLTNHHIRLVVFFAVFSLFASSISFSVPSLFCMTVSVGADMKGMAKSFVLSLPRCLPFPFSCPADPPSVRSFSFFRKQIELYERVSSPRKFPKENEKIRAKWKSAMLFLKIITI